MIKALVQNKAGTNVIIEMPCDGYHLSCRPWDRTSRIPPSGLKVSDDNDGGVRVTLTAENPAGEQLISVFGPRNTLSDVNNVVNAVANARPEVRREMEQRILSGRYSSPDDVEGDLYVSFWDSGDDYFMYTDDEMETHLHGSMTMGGLT